MLLGIDLSGLEVHFAYRLALFTDDTIHHGVGVRPETLVKFEGICTQLPRLTGRQTLELSRLVHDRHLALLVHRMFGVVEALVNGIGLLDVSKMPFPHMNGGIAGLAQDFGESYLPCRESIACDHCLCFAGPCPGGVPSGHHGHTGRRATGLGIHPHEGEAFLR